MKPITTFGVGCFHFAIKLEPPYRFRPARYPAIIQSVLSNLDTVDHFSVSSPHFQPSDERDQTLTAHALSMLHDDTFLAGYIDAVEFSLRIPQRVQEDIIKTIRGQDYRWIGLGTEHFRVRMHYFYHGPVTVVERLDLDDNAHDNPSDAVIVVREYLRHKLKESKTDIQFESVGPSPFHANFVVLHASESERPHVEHIERRGYDLMKVYIPTYISKDRTAWALEWMGDHLSFYYCLQRLSARQARKWEKVEDTWRSLDEFPSSGSLFGSIRASIRRRRAITRLVDGVLLFQAETLSDRQIFVSAMRNIQNEDENLEFLDKRLHEELEEAFWAYPTAEVLELAKFYETRDSKRRDRGYVLLAAVMGGAIGAILSQLPSVGKWVTALFNQPG